MKINKKVGVLYTSGLDSTYLVYKNLKEGNLVSPFYVEFKNNSDKTKAEKYNTSKQHELLKDEFGDFLCPLRDILALHIHEYNYTTALVQAPVWIYAAQFIQSYDLDEIQIAYVMNDDAISYLDDLQTLYKAYHALSHGEKEQIPLAFPLVKTSKKQILDGLPVKYRKHLWSCELPQSVGTEEEPRYVPCNGECHPCRRYRYIEQEFGGNYSSEYPALYGTLRNEPSAFMKLDCNIMSDVKAEKLAMTFTVDHTHTITAHQEEINFRPNVQQMMDNIENREG